MTIYTWDEAKRKSNLCKHGLDFADACAVLEAEALVIEDFRHDYGEQRYNAYGWWNAQIVCITYTERRNGLRIISFRKATRQESRRYLRRSR
ncbi:BrnT family toxin [Duganella levis]|uniref:BrnT family toxin n=1 Tax=Duganella levis TaxID=2692169 RepID=A0ABW9VVL2_9BURK|nr:BrnT family toxin [Duganella levis]